MVELLIVVSIVALLMSLLLPSLTGAREIARRAECAARLRSVLTMSHNYETDYAMLLPTYMSYPSSLTFYGSGIDSSNAVRAGQQLLIEAGYAPREVVTQSYVTSNPWNVASHERRQRRINPFACRSGTYWGTSGGYGYNNEAPAGGWSSQHRDVMDTEIQFAGYIPPSWISMPLKTAGAYSATGRWTMTSSYVMNENFCRNSASVAPAYYEALKSLERSPTASRTPSRKMMFIEGAQVGHWTTAAQMSSEYANSLNPTAWRLLRVPHRDTLNFAAYDGHVAIMTRDNIRDVSGKGAAALNAVNNTLLPFDF